VSRRDSSDSPGATAATSSSSASITNDCIDVENVSCCAYCSVGDLLESCPECCTVLCAEHIHHHKYVADCDGFKRKYSVSSSPFLPVSKSSKCLFTIGLHFNNYFFTVRRTQSHMFDQIV
jgi:hypothetical protein